MLFFFFIKFRVLFPIARIRLRIDCEAITGSATQVGATEIVVTSQSPQAMAQGAAVIPSTSHQPQAIAATNTGGGDVGNGGFPSAQEVLNFIALKYFQTIDPSKPEELNGYLKYLKEVRKVLVLETHQGSLIVTVECRTLQILDELWEDCCTGRLNEVAQQCLVTEDILRAFGLIEVKLTTTIMEEEYRSCREYFLKCQGGYDRVK